MTVFQFVVVGVPQVQGNHRAGRTGKHVKIYDANPKLPRWREQVSTAARHQAKLLDHPMLTGPVRLEVIFWLARPRSAPRTIDIRPITRGGGDWDKLARPIGDALVDAGLLHDDAQIVSGAIEKYYAVGPELPKIYRPDWHWPNPGAHVSLCELARSECQTLPKD